MDFTRKINDLDHQIDAYHRMLNHHSVWFLIATVSAWSLGKGHPVAGLAAAFLIMYFYVVIVFNDLKAEYGDKLIIDGWRVHIKKAIYMLKAEIHENSEGSEQQIFLDLLEKQCNSRLKFKNFFKHRPFLIAFCFFAWMFYEMLLSFLLYLKSITV